MTKKCCGTCHYWQPESEPGGNDSHCAWPHPPLPFWAYIDEGDHRDYTEAKQGKNCPTWTEKEQHADR